LTCAAEHREEADPFMATIDDFTPEELLLIQHAPVRVIAGAVASEPDGMTGSMREMIDGVEGFANTMAREGDRLLNDLFRSIDQTAPDDFDMERISLAEHREAVMQEGIESAREALAVLQAKADPADAATYADALLDAAEAAVHAAKTGGFLGFGSAEVSEREAAYVQRLAEALRPGWR
jgi:hypothetical protein